MEKERLNLLLSEGIKDEIKLRMKDDNCANMSEYIEKAIKFYMGYNDAQNNINFIMPAVSEMVKSQVGTIEKRLSTLLYKEAVEIAMLSSVVSTLAKISPEQMSALRGRCVREVSSINGIFTFEDAYKFQHGEKDE